MCARCERLVGRGYRYIERHCLCFRCFRWVIHETGRRLAAAGRGNGLPLIELSA